MKKFLISIILIISLMSNALIVFAGDIPESLMHSEDAQIFFGEVLAYHPDKENPDVEVAIVATIKGNIEAGTKHTYLKANPVGNYNVREGKVYLFTYYDEANTTDVFEVTTYNTKTLKLKHVEGNMWERFEKYLNQGKYGEAKIEGMLPYRVDVIDTIVISVISILSIVGLILILRDKKIKDKDTKTKIIFVLEFVFSILTIVNGYFVITHRFDNAGYAVIPMVFAIALNTLLLHKNNKKGEENKK